MPETIPDPQLVILSDTPHTDLGWGVTSSLTIHAREKRG